MTMAWLSVGGFLIGGIPLCWLAVYYFTRDESGQRIDLRYFDSGNVGASNAMRVLGWKWWLALFLADAAKGYVSVTIAEMIGVSLTTLCVVAFMTVLGHCFPVYLSFKRGKGISTTVGVLVALGLYRELALAAIVSTIVFACSRYVSLSSLVGALALVVSVWIFGESVATQTIVILLSMLIWARHAPNIARLINGSETKMRFRNFDERPVPR